MTMKHLCIIAFFAAASVLCAADPAPVPAAAKPAESAKPAEAKIPVSVLTTIYRTNPEPSAFADQEKAENLLNRRAELVEKIQNERKRILTEDAAAKKLSEEILLLNRKLASLLETKKSMIELNSQLLDLDIAISRLKPAPQPNPEDDSKDGEKDDGKKTDGKKADKE